jgi:hypothetical protein
MTETVTETVVKQETAPSTGKYTHIVSPPENVGIFNYLRHSGVEDPTAKDIVDFGRKFKVKVKALCGYVWVPDDDPEKYDACPICMDVAGMHMRNAGE